MLHIVKNDGAIEIQFHKVVVGSLSYLQTQNDAVKFDNLSSPSTNEYHLSSISSPIILIVKIVNSTAIFEIITNNLNSDFYELYFHLNFDEMVHFTRRSNSEPWTRPTKISRIDEFWIGNVNYAYFKLGSILVGMLPLTNQQYQSTFIRNEDNIGIKAQSGIIGTNQPKIKIFALSVGALSDGVQLLQKGIRQATERNPRIKPSTIWSKLGWCSWNASLNGSILNSDWLVKNLSILSKNQRFGWAIIDDGWMIENDKKLSSFSPKEQLFPGGFLAVKQKLKELGIPFLGVWHTVHGYWNGIDINSSLGNQYKHLLYEYSSNNYWIRNELGSINSFYHDWYSQLKSAGISFTKIDNQNNLLHLAAGKYSIPEIARNHHQIIEKIEMEMSDSSLNCMCMTPENYFNFGTNIKSIARVCEDYFPNASNYDFYYGNAASHLIQATFNSIYFDVFAICDYDMFETFNPHAELHAVARTLHNGPIYITDDATKTNFKLLEKICYTDGRVINSDSALLPTADCLFVVQDCKLLKFVSYSNGVGVLLAVNFADCDIVEGSVSIADVFPNNDLVDYLVYDYNSKSVSKQSRNEHWDLKVKRMDWRLFFVVPNEKSTWPIGNIDKYNSPATLNSWTCAADQTIEMQVHEGGTILIYSETKPTKCFVDMRPSTNWTFTNNLIEISINELPSRIRIVQLSFN